MKLRWIVEEDQYGDAVTQVEKQAQTVPRIETHLGTSLDPSA